MEKEVQLIQKKGIYSVKEQGSELKLVSPVIRTGKEIGLGNGVAFIYEHGVVRFCFTGMTTKRAIRRADKFLGKPVL